jgi:hypothetical protein
MNASHGMIGVGATSGMAMLTVLLTGFHGLDGDHASAAAWWILTGSGAIYAMVQWFIRWRWPNAPALPGEIVEVPPNAPAIQVAQVQPQPAPIDALPPEQIRPLERLQQQPA